MGENDKKYQMSKLVHWAKSQNYLQLWQRGGIYVALIFVALGLSTLSPYFFTSMNLIELLNFTVIIAIVAIGQTFVIGGKGIDLSVGAVVAITAGVMGILAKDFGLSPFIVMPLGIVFATLLGTLNGFLITRLGVPDLVVTLAAMEIWRGVVYLNFEERVISRFDPVMRFFGNHRFFGTIPAAIFLLVVLVIIASFVLRRTALGRYILAIGGNRKAAEYAGINYMKYKMLSYSISGFFCGIASLVLLGRLNAIQSSLGLMYEMQSIAAVVIGGTLLTGGSASVFGAVGGALLIAMIRNGLMIGGINFYWYMIILGVLLVLSVAIPSWERRKEIK